MHVKELWRYPVKSMRGERLEHAEVEKTGLRGDRNIVVVSAAGDRMITARTHPGLLGLTGSMTPEGVAAVDGHLWHSREARELASDAAGERVQLVDAGRRAERFDVLPLLVATDGAVAELNLEMRRLRPNIVVGDVTGHAEREWPGRRIRSGEVAIDVAQRRMRCVMTTYDPDTLVQDSGVLRRIVRESQGKLALDCSVAAAGTLRLGDAVELAA